MPCFGEEEELEDPLTPQEDQAINILDEMHLGSEPTYDGGISDNSSSLPSSKADKYRIPLRQKRVEPGLLPSRTTESQLLWFLTVTCSCCPYLYFGSAIMFVTYFVNFR